MPRLGIALWQACVWAVVGSVVLLVGVTTPDGISHRMAAAFTLCLHTGHRISPSPALGSAVNLPLA